jgi:hypothetical protein
MPDSPAVTQQPSLEDKLLAAAQQSEQVVAVFSPQIAELVATGVSVEPIFSGIVKMIVGLFQHHTTAAPATK